MTSTSRKSTERSAPPAHALTRLPNDELDLVTELVLQSGSLKGLAAAYGVSYPTIRSRLDRVIGHLRDALEGRRPDPVRELLARLIESGELSPSGARAIAGLVDAERPGGAR